MNPVLLKTEADSRSQVVVMGKPWLTLEGRDYLSLRAEVWPKVCGAMDRMCADFDLVIAEGAGSPAEINLNDREIVNMSVARYLDAPVILAADIDRGGVFASLVGTLALLDDGDAQRVRGFLINKFRGMCLSWGMAWRCSRSGRRAGPPWASSPGYTVFGWLRRIRWPWRASGVWGTGGAPGVKGMWISLCRAFRGWRISTIWTHWPWKRGWESVSSSLPPNWAARLRCCCRGARRRFVTWNGSGNAGLAERIRDLTDSGVPVVGICGGFQMMGRDIVDETGIEGPPGRSDGLGILNVRTVFEAVKRTRPVQARVSGEAAGGGRGTAAGAPVRGYEIHMGRTSLGTGVRPLFDLLDEVTGEPVGPDGAISDGALAGGGRHWGTYLHGVFDEPAFRRSWLESLGWRPRGKARSLGEERETELNRLADTVEEATDMDELDRIVGI
jgi:adenosylcobyric acid synthase